ncbi:MAG: CDP-glycerol glycerophosphotransferase family protein [Spirochaetes bacterium]|nr:CDP-glycerol glycerophosphotransferase family protein [Spirochaetota bacterium]
MANKIIPLTKGKIIFTSKKGQFFGNPMYFFMHLIEIGRGQPIWVTKSENTYNDICDKSSARNVLLLKNISDYFLYIYHYLTSEAIIIGNRSDFWNILKHTKTTRRKVINLGHGLLLPGTKKTGIEIRPNKRTIKSEIKRRRAVSYYTMCSDIEKYIRSAAYFVDLNNFIVTGVPRSDIVIKNLNNQNKLYHVLNNLIKPKVSYKKIILYAPTHRDVGKWKNSGQVSVFFPFKDFHIDRLNTFLSDNDTILLLRTHDNENKFGSGDKSQVEPIVNNDRIFYFSHAILAEVNEILPIVDLLITDYSTIGIDFLLCNRPIIYFPYDLKDYPRGIILDYDSWTPGEKIYDFEKFLLTARENLIHPKNGSSERERLKNIFHHYLDGNSCERILNYIEN